MMPPKRAHSLIGGTQNVDRKRRYPKNPVFGEEGLRVPQFDTKIPKESDDDTVMGDKTIEERDNVAWAGNPEPCQLDEEGDREMAMDMDMKMDNKSQEREYEMDRCHNFGLLTPKPASFQDQTGGGYYRRIPVRRLSERNTRRRPEFPRPFPLAVEEEGHRHMGMSNWRTVEPLKPPEYTPLPSQDKEDGHSMYNNEPDNTFCGSHRTGTTGTIVDRVGLESKYKSPYYESISPSSPSSVPKNHSRFYAHTCQTCHEPNASSCWMCDDCEVTME